MVRLVSLVLATAFIGVAACSSNNGNAFVDGTDSSTPPKDDAGNVIDSSNPPIKDSGGNVPDGNGGVSVIYAHTDTELYTMDPGTQKITDIGAFSDGTSTLTPVTDLAVNSAGDVWVNTENAIFKAVVPQSPGPVKITKVADIKVATGQKFYALGFTPAGALEAGETLIAGDSLGDLYAVDTQGNLSKLGAFGTDGSTGVYELSGDVVFYTLNNKPRGLATVRLVKKGVTLTNDILAEIDMAAMATAFSTKTPAASLKKQFIGAGTGFGKLFGIGAWNDAVYAFERLGSATPARLIKIDNTGVGTVIQSFPNITAGWSGAGVTTSATVTILPPN